MPLKGRIPADLRLAGQGRARKGRAGQGRARQGEAGQGRAGQGRAGQGRAGQGRAPAASESMDNMWHPSMSTGASVTKTSGLPV